MSIWPDTTIEKIMLEDAAQLERDFDPRSTGHDAACHIKALLQRVRDLEGSVLALSRYEDAIKAMAYQLLPNYSSPKQVEQEMEKMVKQLLEEPS